MSGSRPGYKREKRECKNNPPTHLQPTKTDKDLNTKENHHTPVLAILISGFPALSFF